MRFLRKQRSLFESSYHGSEREPIVIHDVCFFGLYDDIGAVMKSGALPNAINRVGRAYIPLKLGALLFQDIHEAMQNTSESALVHCQRTNDFVRTIVPYATVNDSMFVIKEHAPTLGLSKKLLNEHDDDREKAIEAGLGIIGGHVLSWCAEISEDWRAQWVDVARAQLGSLAVQTEAVPRHVAPVVIDGLNPGMAT